MRLEPFWLARFGKIPPLGHRLRTRFSSRWLRIHSLDNAKRYADNIVERAEILSRANRTGDVVLGDEAPCWLVVPEYELASVTECVGAQLAPAMTVIDEGAPVPFHAADVTWRAGAFDDLLHAIAGDRGRALWVAKATAEIYAPYDGGIDVIFASSQRRDELRGDFARWISPRADGL